IHGSVARPRFDLGNQELIEAHLHSVWMQHIGIGLAESVPAVIYIELPAENYPIRADIEAQLQPSESTRNTMMQAFEAIAQTVGDPLLKAPWYRGPEWLREMLDGASSAFNGAFDEWRLLYGAAMQQRQQALNKHDKAKSKEEIKQAEQELNEALRDL